jgi:hypothetical protein
VRLPPSQKDCPPLAQGKQRENKSRDCSFGFFAVFARLIGDAAGGFARRLAGGLAFAAAALAAAFGKVARLDGLDVLHKAIPFFCNGY